MAYKGNLAIGIRGSSPALKPSTALSGNDLVKRIRSGQSYTTPKK